MAAPMFTFKHATSKLGIQRLTFIRHYARHMRRSVRGVISPEDDARNTKSSVDPRQNPFVPFIPDDPIQETMVKKIDNARSKAHIKTEVVKMQTKVKNNTNNKSSSDNSYKMLKGVSIKDKNVSNMDQGDQLQKNTVIHKHLDKEKKKENVRLTKNRVEYEFLNSDDKRFGRLILQAKSRKGRSDHSKVVLEGKNLILDAVQSGVKLEKLYFTNPDILDDLPIEGMDDVDLYRVLYKHLQILSDVETSQGLLGVFKLPNLAAQSCDPLHLPVTLICDNIRDGGNLGTLIRTAAAVGCQRVVVLKGCVDIWNTKVLRAAMGAHFRVPIHSNIAWPQVPALLTHNSGTSLRVFLADVKQPTKYHIEKLSGSEVSMLKIESLSLKSRNKERQLLDTNEDNASDSDSDYDASTFEIDKGYCNKKILDVFKDAPLNVQMYNQAVYGDRGNHDNHSVLVVSGETSGVSAEARKLTYDNYGECVCIPMVGNIESLNCAIAGSVILYEIHRQLNIKDE